METTQNSRKCPVPQWVAKKQGAELERALSGTLRSRLETSPTGKPHTFFLDNFIFQTILYCTSAIESRTKEDTIYI
jgi:hypothetical protein